MHTLVFVYSVGSIQTDLFNSFLHLSFIYVEMSNLRNFFHKIGIEWTLYLKSNSAIVFGNGVDKFAKWTDDSGYDYPDPNIYDFIYKG
jgi:hypothetical protein